MFGPTRKQKTGIPWAGREKKARITEVMIKRIIYKKKYMTGYNFINTNRHRKGKFIIHSSFTFTKYLSLLQHDNWQIVTQRNFLVIKYCGVHV